jgi:hypothetical protein
MAGTIPRALSKKGNNSFDDYSMSRHFETTIMEMTKDF